MKNLFLILAVLFFSGCSKENKGTGLKNTFKDSLVIYSEQDWYKISHYNIKVAEEKIKVVDTLCIAEEKRARKDIGGKKWTYTLFYGLSEHDYSNAEISDLLIQYGIKLDSASVPCVIPRKGFRWHCYEDLMNAAITEKFGKNFIDSLRQIADLQYIKNHPEQVFSFYECDRESRYAAAKTYEDYLKMPEDDFVKALNYKGLAKNQLQKLSANTEVTFILYKNGTVGNIKPESDFTIAGDKNFARYFEAQAIAFVKAAKWQPAKYRGILVNSDMHLNFYNK